jgi:hypothetical protein
MVRARALISIGLLAVMMVTLAAAQAPRKPVAGIATTPNSLCVDGTQHMLNTTRQLKLQVYRYCSDADWPVQNVEQDDRNVYWNVKFEDGKTISCVCRKR